MTKICHVSDIHIRGLEYHDEIKFTFEELYKSIEEKKCQLTVVCGDLFHSKTQVTSEYFVILTEFFDNLLKLSDVVVIPGNHDAILNNPSRVDAISPVVNSLLKSNEYKNKLYFSKRTEKIHLPQYNIKFYHYSIYDNKAKWNKIKQFDDACINICLYHGSINNSKLDNDWVSRGNRDDISLFDDFDAAFLGDIHVRQFLTPKIAYPGSIRQNNYGEDLAKGYIFWEINGKNDFKSEEITLPQKRHFFTINIQDEKELDKIKIPYKDCRIRVNIDKQLTFQEENKIRGKVKLLFSPCNEVPVLSLAKKYQNSQVSLGNTIINNENIRDEETQKKLILDYFKDKNFDQKTLDSICDLDKKYNFFINKEHFKRNIIWKPETLKWNNFLSYGENNELDFTQLKGLIGIFGGNAQGKSSMIDAIMYAFDSAVMREGANRNIDYINNYKTKCDVELTTVCQDDKYVISRSTTKKILKSGEEKANGEVSFIKIKDGKEICLNAEDGPKTNLEIRKIFGTSEDFSITSLCSQWGLSKFIDSRGTERKKTFAKLLDLEIFDEKYKVAYEDFISIKEKVKVLENPNLAKELFDLRKNINLCTANENALNKDKAVNITDLDTINERINEKLRNFNPILEHGDNVGHIITELTNLNYAKEMHEELIGISNKNLFQINEELKKYKISSKEQLIEYQKQYNHADLMLKANINKLNLTNNKIDLLKKRVLLINKSPNQEICKSCFLLSDAHDAKDELKIHETIKQDIIFEQSAMINDFPPMKINDIQQCFNLYEEQIKQFQMKERASLKLASTIEQINSLIKKIENYKLNEEKEEKNEQIETDLVQLKIIKSELEEAIKSADVFIDQSLKRKYLDEATLAAKQEQKSKFDKLSKEYDLYDAYLEAMGKNGISYMILSKKIPLINDEINSILANIVDFKINIENNEEEKTMKIYVVDKFKKRIIELCSGFEKTVASIALRTALWKISNLPKAPILILDEAFGFLNNEKMDTIINFLIYLKNYFETIFIISHNNDLKTMMDHVLFVEKNSEGFSQIRN